MNADQAIEIATRWLVNTSTPHGIFRSVFFLWRFDLERWANHYCHYSYQQWRKALRNGPVEDRYVLVEKWRVVFESGAEKGGNCITVDVDDRTGRVRTWDG